MQLITLALVCMVAVVSCDDVINNYCCCSAKDDEFVAFSVGSKKGFAPKNSQRVPMETTIYNAGGYFRSSDNAFHAPFNGVYFFTFSVVANTNKWADMTLMTQKNGLDKVAVARSIDRGVQGPGGAAGASVIVQLEAGETVFVWFNADGINYGIRATDVGAAPCTMFSGELRKKL